MTALIGRLLSLAQNSHAPQMTEVNLADVTLMASEIHGQAAQKRGIHLVVEVSDASTQGDFNALVLAAGNLMQNAIKYSPEGSAIHLSCSSTGDAACLRVQDAGPGIPAQDHERLVQPFQRGTTATGRPGAGLGLALVQAIMEAHGGRLELKDRFIGGLTAQLVLPRHRSASVQA